MGERQIKGYPEILYPRGFVGMPFRVFDNDEAPQNPLGAAAGAGRLGGNKGLIV